MADRERERKKREDKAREQDELNKIKQQADQEKKKIVDLKKQQKLEKQKADEQSKAIALKNKKEDEKRKKDAEVAKKKEDAEKKRLADLKKQLEQEETDARERQRINKLLAQEEAERRGKERTTTVVSKFFAGIQRKIEQKRTVDPGFETWRKSVVDIKLSPSGEVVSVRTIESSGLSQYDQSVESAIYAASPFDMPDRSQDPDAVKRLLNFDLVVEHPNARR